MHHPLTAAILAASALLLPAVGAHAQCTPHVSDNYAPANILGTTYCSAMFDDGSGTGPCLFVGGDLYAAGVNCPVAKLVDGQWVPLQILGGGTARTLAVMDDGSGPALYAGGNFLPSANIAKWNGSTWTTLPYAGNTSIQSLAQYPAGPGGTIYAATGVAPSNSQLLRFTGAAWEVIPNIVNSQIYTLKVLDDGSGSKLYIGGSFNVAGGLPASGIATWDGAICRPLGSGFSSGAGPYVSSITLHDDGSGPKIHAAGKLYLSSSPSQVAALVGNTWTSRLAETYTSYQSATGLASVTDEQGAALYVATGDAMNHAKRVRVLRNGVWSDAGGEFTDNSDTRPTIVSTLDAYATPSGPMLLALGGLTTNGSFSTPSMAIWKNGLWLNIQPKSQSAYIVSGIPFSDPASTSGELYWNSRVMRTPDGWSQSNQPPVDPFVTGVRANVDGESCFVIGAPTAILAKRASAWTSLPRPFALRGSPIAADLGAGPELYTFHGDSTNTNRVLSKYVNGAWEPVGPALYPIDSSVERLIALDLGSGQRLHVIHALPNSSTNRIWQLDGTAWNLVGSIEGAISSLATFDVGDGPELIIAGDLPASGSTTFNGLARWNGARLAPIGEGLDLQTGIWVSVIPTPSGPQLWAGGSGGQVYGYWNGSSWARPYSISYVNPYRPNVPMARFITSVNNPDGSRSIFLSGRFTEFAGAPASDFAEIITCPPSCTADFNSDGDYGTDADIEAFFACLAGNCCPTCATADFNNDGDYGTDADFESFFRVLAGGPC